MINAQKNPPELSTARAYRQTIGTCHEAGVCLHPVRACTDICQPTAAMQRLAPGTVDGPYRSRMSLRDHACKLALLLSGPVALVAVVWLVAAWVL